jgi:hypothetical protein
LETGKGAAEAGTAAKHEPKAAAATAKDNLMVKSPGSRTFARQVSFASKAEWIH